MKLFLIRHGDPDYANDCLTERGKTEAELLSERLKRENIRKVFVSPMGRAKLTAEPYLRKTGMTAETREFLREFGKHTASPDGENYRKTAAWHTDNLFWEENIADMFSDGWRDKVIYKTYGASDEADRIVHEFEGFLSELGLTREGRHFRENERFDDGDTAIFCHYGVGCVLLSYLTEIPLPIFWQKIDLQPSSLSTVIFKPAAPGIRVAKAFAIGDTTHLGDMELLYKE